MTGREWDMDVEVSRNLNHVQRELTVHSTVLASNAESMKNLSQRSDERLEYLRERFDGLDRSMLSVASGLDSQVHELREERRRILVTAFSLFTAICTGVWFAVVVPVNNEIIALREKVDAIEKRTDWRHNHDVDD